MTFLRKYECQKPNVHANGLFFLFLPTDEAENFEPEPQGSVVGVAIENLSKVFGKQKPAVNGLTLNFHQDQINCFLGRNGAGKTTTM